MLADYHVTETSVIMMDPISTTGARCQGHEERLRGQRQVQKWRKTPASPLDPSLTLPVKTGPGPVQHMNLQDLENLQSQGPEFQRMKAGGTQVVPQVEVRVDKAPLPDRAGAIKYKEGKANKILSFPLTDDEEAIKMKNLAVYNKYMDQRAEVTLKEAIVTALEPLHQPSLVVRSVELTKRGLQDFQTLGLFPVKPSQGDWEADLLVAVAGVKLKITLLEVKRKDVKPGEVKSRPPDKQAINKAIDQLFKDTLFLQVNAQRPL